ncbi:MAG: alkaline phosphatase family protein [Spirochaetales bacterium]|nr:alkaline phosphatase family protein [Spirochaetales bacterium]
MQQKILIAMMDGFGIDYYEKSDIPSIKRMAKDGLFFSVKGIFPSVTNVNNISIACGAWPSEHGIAANSYYDTHTGTAEYMNAADMIQCKTIFQRAAEQGISSALLTSKKKTKELLGGHVKIAVAAEDPTPEQIAAYGQPAGIYSKEINYWLWNAAKHILDTQPDIGLVYVHITDYPMHAWPPSAPESIEHLKTIDSILGSITAAHPDVAVFLTADHGMNFKTRCWDLEKALAHRGAGLRFVLSPERDYYIKHHRNFTGCAWVWLNNPADEERVRGILTSLDGVEAILTKEEAAGRFHLPAAYIGDLVVLGDKDTMFGDMDSEFETLPPEYRAHGSLHEMDLPLIIYNYREKLPEGDVFLNNKDLTAFLFR